MIDRDDPFEKRADEYDAWYARHRLAYRSEIQALRRLVGSPGRALEVGVGTGRFAAPLGVPLGVDPAVPMLRADHACSETDPAVSSDALTTASLMVLESLTPTQRAVYLLREVFGYGYKEIARIMDTSEAACRQHVHRARERLEERDRRYEPSPEDAEEVAEEFLACWRGRDASGKERSIAHVELSPADSR